MKSVSISAVIAGFVTEFVIAVICVMPIMLMGIENKSDLHRLPFLGALLVLTWMILTILVAHLVAGFAIGKISKSQAFGSIVALAAISALFTLHKGGIIAAIVQFPISGTLYYLGSRLAK